MDFETFRQALLDALIHLHDPSFQPPAPLYSATGCEPDAGPGPVQAHIARAIENLRPDDSLPRSSRAWREYEVLVHRFLLGLSVEESAERLYLARRTLQRVQRQALQALSRHLWEAWQTPQPPSTPAPGPAADWRAQAQRELALLQTDTTAPVTEVAPVVRDVLDMGTLLTGRPDIPVQQGFVQPDLVAGVHRSALKQMLVTAVRRLALRAAGGPITIYGGLEDGQARVTLTALFDPAHPPSEAALVGDILLPAGASTAVQLKEDTVFLSLRLPSPGTLTVVVLDDNPDIVHFYRRCVAGSVYRIIEAPSASRLFELLDSVPVHAIVLDIMLPDVDGWKLLMRLYEDPRTRAIPVVVSTVVREEELALSLGAAAYLAKPVSPQQFVRALDRVTTVPQTAEPRTAERSSGSGWQ